MLFSLNSRSTAVERAESLNSSLKGLLLGGDVPQVGLGRAASQHVQIDARATLLLGLHAYPVVASFFCSVGDCELWGGLVELSGKGRMMLRGSKKHVHSRERGAAASYRKGPPCA
jgi:hypothetical protein